ncbi:hypothetical protein CNMCM6106_003273 [Aspergillus hiratsukae]|uniref:WSC domain-containing protein n=1 Tax=Aspergillus hiratsukae TaxID=1194566 RepID=A0A8H6Q7R3_9EURO|nr:hypothetical protein CNMCM6106_003273 [Aspergillus hiratsukae]
MKTTLLSLVALGGLHFCASSQTPGLQWDPDTIASCVEWYDNNEGLTCEEARKYWGITPEQFTEWNPSVSLDCEPWRYQSYCIVTQERLDNSTKTTTTSAPASTSTPTTTQTTLGPSPTAWTALGCYFDDPKLLPLLETRVSKEGGDPALTIAKCQNACYLAARTFAGVKAGNECWCSPFVGGEHARNQSDCNIPWSGDKDEICGGKQCVNVFEPVEADEDDGPVTKAMPTSTFTTSSATTGTGGDNGTRIDDKPADSGARRNFALF